MIEIRWEGVPVAKSNSYEIIVLNRKGERPRGSLKVSDRVKAVEHEFFNLFTHAVPYRIEWAIPKGLKTLRPINPVFPKGEEVDIEVLYFRPNLKGPDVDNILKSIEDSATHAGIWFDDRQVRDTVIRRRLDPNAPSHVIVRIRSAVDEKAVFLPSPLARRDWLDQTKADESLREQGKLPDQVLNCFCDLCDVGIGAHMLHEEAWVFPIIKRGNKVSFKLLCSSCADEKQLPFTYRVIDIYLMRTLKRFQAGPIIVTRQKEIAHDIVNRYQKPGTTAARSRVRKPVTSS